MSIEPDFKNPKREPVISLIDPARLNDGEIEEGCRDGAEGAPCGDNRSRQFGVTQAGAAKAVFACHTGYLAVAPRAAMCMCIAVRWRA